MNNEYTRYKVTNHQNRRFVGNVNVHNENIRKLKLYGATALLITTSMIASIVGGVGIYHSRGNPKIQPATPPAIEEAIEKQVATKDEETKRYIYRIANGDSLWKIAALYRPHHYIPQEIEKIRKDNNLGRSSIIGPGTAVPTLILDIPIEFIIMFNENRLEEVEVSTWEPSEIVRR